MKAAGLIWLVTSARFGGEFNDHMDGIIYGFAVVMDFTAVEDGGYLYESFMEGGIPLATGLFSLRSVLFGIWHGSSPP